ncbi:MAG: hypothetical protein FWH47_00485 [Methanomassiliicoccaceae archaeon]|nr:hypothetical protein [Methanomassiliicoccaceae archaeon]
MSDSTPEEILDKAKVFFRERVVSSHIKNVSKLKLDTFNINPFTWKYLSFFVFGNDDPESLAKVLIYPRVMGTSISTTFGSHIQAFCSDVLSGYASLIDGIDIEYVDQTDGRRKYCQIKAGPETINSGDVETITNRFRGIKNLARTNNQREINPALDCVVGVLYGDFEDLSGNYLRIKEEFPVICGKTFWHRLTGDEGFYTKLIDAFTEVAMEIDEQNMIRAAIDRVAAQISASDSRADRVARTKQTSVYELSKR